jgi:hypothetical protein
MPRKGWHWAVFALSPILAQMSAICALPRSGILERIEPVPEFF